MVKVAVTPGFWEDFLFRVLSIFCLSIYYSWTAYKRKKKKKNHLFFFSFFPLAFLFPFLYLFSVEITLVEIGGDGYGSVNVGGLLPMGQLATVCHRGNNVTWGLIEARVVCHHLGFHDADFVVFDNAHTDEDYREIPEFIVFDFDCGESKY